MGTSRKSLWHGRDGIIRGDRSVNDMVTHLLWHFGQQMGGKGKADLRAIECELNNMPQRPIGWKFAHERFVEILLRV